MLMVMAMTSAAGGELPVPVATSAELGVPFDRFVTTDRLDREITWYLSTATDGDPLPIALWIGGSGGQSAFDSRGGRISAGLQGVLLAVADHRARVMVVEKPGVAFGETLSEPGTAIDASAAAACSCERVFRSASSRVFASASAWARA